MWLAVPAEGDTADHEQSETSPSLGARGRGRNTPPIGSRIAASGALMVSWSRWRQLLSFPQENGLFVVASLLLISLGISAVSIAATNRRFGGGPGPELWSWWARYCGGCRQLGGGRPRHPRGRNGDRRRRTGVGARDRSAAVGSPHGPRSSLAPGTGLSARRRSHEPEVRRRQGREAASGRRGACAAASNRLSLTGGTTSGRSRRPR